MRPPTDAQIQVWWELCKDVPEGQPLDWVRRRLLEAENCPRNLGAEVGRLWSAWREAHPEMCVNTPKKCPDCDEPGLIYVWTAQKPDPETGEIPYRRSMAMCACHPSRAGKSKREIIASGGLVMPGDFKGGPANFEKENGLRTFPEQRGPRKPFLARIGMDLTPNPKRFRHLPENERPITRKSA